MLVVGAFYGRCATVLSRGLDHARKRGLLDANPAKDAVRTPVLGKLDGSARQVALMLVELRLESLQKRESVSSTARKAGDHARPKQERHWARRGRQR